MGVCILGSAAFLEISIQSGSCEMLTVISIAQACAKGGPRCGAWHSSCKKCVYKVACEIMCLQGRLRDLEVQFDSTGSRNVYVRALGGIFLLISV